MLAGQGLGGWVRQQIQHARRLCAGKTPARIPGQAEQIQQHLAVQTAVDLFQVQLFAAGLVVHHPHPAGAVVLDPLICAVHRAHQLHRAPVRQAVYLSGHSVLAPAYFQLTGHGLELGLVLLVPQIAQQTGHALFQPGEQVGKACGILRQIAPRVLVHQCGGKVGHGGIIQLQKGAQPGAGVVCPGVGVQRHLQHPVHQGTALVCRKLCTAAGLEPQHILQKVAVAAGIVFFQLAGRDVQPPAQQHFQRGQILHLPGRVLLHALQQRKPPGCLHSLTGGAQRLGQAGTFQFGQRPAAAQHV